MNTVNKDELYQNLSNFLKIKGIELKEGTYALRLQQGCNVLAEIVNTTQHTVGTAKAKVDIALDQLRETIHQATAPKPPRAAPAASAPPPSNPAAAAPPAKTTRPKSKPRRPAKASAKRSRPSAH
jgi:hypothetical protein